MTVTVFICSNQFVHIHEILSSKFCEWLFTFLKWLCIFLYVYLFVRRREWSGSQCSLLRTRRTSRSPWQWCSLLFYSYFFITCYYRVSRKNILIEQNLYCTCIYFTLLLHCHLKLYLFQNEVMVPNSSQKEPIKLRSTSRASFLFQRFSE